MIGLLLIIIGQIIFWGSAFIYTKHLKAYDFWSNIGSGGFWLTVLGIIFLIW